MRLEVLALFQGQATQRALMRRPSRPWADPDPDDSTGDGVERAGVDSSHLTGCRGVPMGGMNVNRGDVCLRSLSLSRL